MTTATDNGLAASVQALTEALRTACNDPADAVRLLITLAGYTPAQATSTAPIGAAMATLSTAMGQLCRRAALTSLARACATYQPSSFNDAMAVRQAAAMVFDAEILVAGDAAQDATYSALRSLRAAVLTDLAARGADLASLTTVTTPKPRASLALAYQLYRDATRSDDLIARANPVHPGFLPTSFEALNA